MKLGLQKELTEPSNVATNSMAVKFSNKSTTSVEYMTNVTVDKIPKFPDKIRRIAAKLNLKRVVTSLNADQPSVKRKIPSMKSDCV